MLALIGADTSEMAGNSCRGKQGDNLSSNYRRVSWRFLQCDRLHGRMAVGAPKLVEDSFRRADLLLPLLDVLARWTPPDLAD